MKNLNYSAAIQDVNKIAFKVKFLPPTNTKGARISVKNTKNDKRQILSFDYRFSSIQDQFCAHIDEIAPALIYIDQFWDGDAVFITYAYHETDRQELAAVSSIYTY